MYTSNAISKIGLFDMSWPRVSCMWVCKPLVHWPYKSVWLLGIINEHINMYTDNKNAIIVIMSCIVY